MKKLYCLLLICFAVSGLSAQRSEIVAGKNLLTGKDIRAERYEFDKPVHSYYLDTTTNRVTLHLRERGEFDSILYNRGRIVMYDLANDKVKWSKNINYSANNLRQYNSTIFITKKYDICLDAETGEDKWDVENGMHYVDIQNNVAVGYFAGGGSNLLQGIDLGTGKILWERIVNREYGWNSFRYLNDNIVLFTAAGLHAVSLRNGTGWSYDAVTGKKDYTVSIIASVLGSIAGTLLSAAMDFYNGAYLVFAGGYNLLGELVSNTLVDGEHIYLSDSETIGCVGFNGQVKWRHKLPKKIASKATIFLRDDSLFMINLGYGIKGRMVKSYGTPFIASFDKNTGEKFFLREFEGDGSPVKETRVDNDYVDILFADKLVKCRLHDGEIVDESSFDMEEGAEFECFTNKNNYIMTDSGIVHLEPHPGVRYVLSGKSVYEFDASFELQGELVRDSLYRQILKTDTYRFFSKDTDAVITDQELNEVGRLKANVSALVHGDKLYDVQDGAFVVVDISDYM